MPKAKKQALTQEERLAQALVPEGEQPYEVPGNWVWTKLGQVCFFKSGYAFKSDLYKDSGVPILRISNIINGEIDFSDCVHYDASNEYRAFIVENGDLLIAMSGATTGKNGVYKHDYPAYLNQRVGNIRVVDVNVLDTRFRDFYIESKSNEILNNAYGGAQPNISAGDICEMLFPLPPLAEQHRIVNRIESLFNKLDRAKELAQAALDSFETRKATILHKAFTGELTDKWREANGVGSDSWEQVPLADLCDSFQYGTSKKSESNGRVVVLRMGNLQEGEIDWNDLAFTNDDEDIDKYSLKAGDVLFNRTNSAEKVGKTSVYRGERPAIFAGYLIRIKYRDCLDGFFLNYMLNTPQAREYCNAVKSDAVNQSNINAKKLAAFEIPAFTIPEQTEIVRILDSLLEKEQQARHLADIIEKIDLMKKAILARAFRGELGTNDPSEESALALLRENVTELR